MSEAKEPSGPTKVKGAQDVRHAAEGEERLIDQLGEPSEPAPEATTPSHGDPLREAQDQGPGTEAGESKP
ncbi:MAG: hypothetical protein QM765_04640 [Myxococcales bacterium]